MLRCLTMAYMLEVKCRIGGCLSQWLPTWPSPRSEQSGLWFIHNQSPSAVKVVSPNLQVGSLSSSAILFAVIIAVNASAVLRAPSSSRSVADHSFATSFATAPTPVRAHCLRMTNSVHPAAIQGAARVALPSKPVWR